MDLLDLYFTSIEDTTKTLSKFVKRYEKEIFSIDYEQEELGAKALRITWIRLWTTAVESRGVENAFSDPNTIDWNYLAELRQEELLRRAAAAKAHICVMNALQTSEDKEQYENVLPFELTEIFEARFKVAVQEAPENDKVSRQDLMTFGIVDLVSNDKDNASHQLLGEKFNTWQEDISQKFGNRHPDINLGIASRNNVYSFARELFEGTDEMEIKTIKKKSHKKELDSKENDYKWKKRTTKLEASKIEKNSNLLDSERRSSGSSIDAIVHLNSISQDFLLVEVSGPNNKEDYDHFRKDRNKLAYNLKSIIKNILKKHLNLQEATNLQILELPRFLRKLNSVLLHAIYSSDVLISYCKDTEFDSDDSGSSSPLQETSMHKRKKKYNKSKENKKGKNKA
ncbi:hypothetical protein HPULCUR_005445 [Helicostylum pulchrum]|uniref:Uncharacterized protein n=1 Tax=Helicostylum pulchrum TaxID=562976 RepID=A0ABP9XZ28_9FUNG